MKKKNFVPWYGRKNEIICEKKRKKFYLCICCHRYRVSRHKSHITIINDKPEPRAFSLVCLSFLNKTRLSCIDDKAFENTFNWQYFYFNEILFKCKKTS